MALLFTDIEGSTQRIRALGDDYLDVQQRHQALMRAAWQAHNGFEVDTQGDSFFVVFDRVEGAVGAALEAQRVLASAEWTGGPLRVRMGIHAGSVVRSGDDYVGLAIHEAARLASSAHGGQIVLSGVARDLIASDLPSITYRDLGEHSFKDVDAVRVWQVEADALASDFPPLRSLAFDAAVDLPAYLSSFVGRGSDLADVATLVGQRRLVTITGPGGAGKTRLAVEVARTRAADVTERAWMVDLTATKPGLVVETVRSTLRVAEQPGRQVIESVIAEVGRRPVLLVVDNCEHVLDDTADVIDALLAGCPALRVLATSREPLALGGEAVFPLAPLATGHGDNIAPAVQLFIDRVRDANVRAPIGPAELEVITALCERLDGLPLALELAASRAATVPLAELERNIGSHLTRRGRTRGQPDRHVTLDAAIEWSYRLLDPEEQRLLEQVSVFVGGFTPRAAAAIAAADDVAGCLSSLAARSLLTTEPWPSNRYSMLETIRGFALRRLAVNANELADASRRHAEHFAAWLRGLGRDLANASDDDLFAIDTDVANLRAALAWAIDNDAELALTLAGRLFRYWSARWRYDEPLDELRRVLDATPHLHTAGRVRLLNGAGHFATMSGRSAEATERHQAALELATAIGSADGVAWATHYLGHAAELQGDYIAAERWGREGLEAFRAVDDTQGIAYSSYWIGRAVLGQCAVDDAAEHMAHCQAAATELGDIHCTMAAHHGAAIVALARGPAGGREAIDEARTLVATAEARADPFFLAHGRAIAAVLEAHSGELTSAHLRAVLAGAQRLNDGHVVALALTAASHMARSAGATEVAARLLSLADEVDRPDALSVARRLWLGDPDAGRLRGAPAMTPSDGASEALQLIDTVEAGSP